MGKLIIGFIFLIVCVVLVVYLLRAVTEVLDKRKTSDADDFFPVSRKADNAIMDSIRDAVFFLKDIRNAPIYTPLASEIDTMTDRLDKIQFIAQKNPGYIPALKDLAEYIIPSMKKFFCDYETYIKTGSSSQRTAEGLETVMKGLVSTTEIFNRAVDDLMASLTADVSSEVRAIRDVYDTREN